ncbi:MAG: creatininase family protein, partial [Desulfobacterales bacterium]|nr:creatininase family protein [Desulfobacterales bacterium]
TNLDGNTYTHLVGDVLREIARHGLRKVCFLNGHFENQWFLTEGIDVTVRQLAIKDLKVVRIEYWDVLDEATVNAIFPEGLNIQFEHAAALETSLMMHLFPDSVRTDRIPSEPTHEYPPYDIFPADPQWGPESGSLSPAHTASADKGKSLIESIVPGVADALVHAFSR